MATSTVQFVFTDGSTFDMDAELVKSIKTISDMASDLDGISCPIPLPDRIEPSVLPLVKVMPYIVSYAKQYPEEPEDVKYYVLDDWSTEFFKPLDYPTISSIMIGANFLAMTGLVERCAVKISQMMQGKTIEQLKQVFCMKRDFTEEELEEFRSEEWNFPTA